MKYPIKRVSLFLIIFPLVFITASCQTTAQSGDTNVQSPTEQKSDENALVRRPNELFYTGDGGKGIVIAVPSPVIENGTAADNWIPQLFQDLITGDFARYSAMTVLDRANEQLILAEQQLTDAGKNSLLAIPEIEVRSTARLAKGMAAEKDGNDVEAAI